MVRIWERGRTEHLVDRALTILSVLSGQPRRQLAALPIGRRDALLFAWRERIFAGTPTGYAACPRCGCGVQVTIAGPSQLAEGPAVGTVETGGRRVPFRSPTSLDLAAIVGSASLEQARQLLAERCVGLQEARDEAVVEAVEDALAASAGGSTIEVECVCPACESTWGVHFDIGSFLWQEIAALARRLLHEVDTLARRYGWSEAEILALSAPRRHFYLALAS